LPASAFFFGTAAISKSSARVAKTGLVFLPFVYGMGLKEPQQVQKRQKKKSACATNEKVPPSGGRKLCVGMLGQKWRRP